jgi:AraC-like DNA-binding protein
MSHDTLSDVLRSIRLRSAMYYFVSCAENWVAEAPVSQAIAAAVMPGADHVMAFHVVTQGECWAAITGETPRKVHRGDVVMLPHGDAHIMSSAPGMRAKIDIDGFFELASQQRPFRLAYNGASMPAVSPARETSAQAGASTTLVCGFVACDMRPFNPLIATLPRLLHLSAAESDSWSEQFVQWAAAESACRRPGSDALLERMSEMMFVDAVRRHIDSLPEQSAGWLSGLRDRFVGRAMALLHEKPATSWTIDDLSKQVGLSRSALHERFVELVGQPPMQYLAQWRMQLASRLLRDSQSSVASIALEVGYESEAAFARAFKRMVGAPPAAWRRTQSEIQSSPTTGATPTVTTQPVACN